MQHLLEEIVYNARMVGFGRGVRLLREAKGLSMSEMARAALGPDATPTDIRDFGNYLSKVELEKDVATNPSLSLIEDYRRGLSLPTLEEFFRQLAEVSKTEQPSVSTIAHTAPFPDSVGGARDGRDSVSQATTDADIDRRLAKIEADTRRMYGVVARLQRAPKTRRTKSARRGARSKKRPKAS